MGRYLSQPTATIVAQRISSSVFREYQPIDLLGDGIVCINRSRMSAQRRHSVIEFRVFGTQPMISIVLRRAEARVDNY